MATKYPIILVHGFLIKDIGLVKSFGRIDKMLKQQGYVVYKSRVDSFGAVETNAEILKAEVEKVLKENNTEKVNIIAHSKGGLDSKYMIEHFVMYEQVASLTTLSTPHKGSPLASKILKFPKWLLRITAFWINLWFKILGDRKPNAYKLCEQLSTINSVEEEISKICSKIYCQSYSTKLKRSRDDFVMGIPLIFFHHLEKNKESDGLVSAESAQFCVYKGNPFNESVSHTEIIDFMVKKKKREKIYAFWNMIVEDLAARGY